MTLPIRRGPTETLPPYFDWDAADNVDLDLDPIEDDEEIDLTDLLERPADQGDAERRVGV